MNVSQSDAKKLYIKVSDYYGELFFRNKSGEDLPVKFLEIGKRHEKSPKFVKHSVYLHVDDDEESVDLASEDDEGL